MLFGRILLAIFILLPCSLEATQTDSPYIPEQLLPWKEWVLQGYEDQLHCTPSTNNPSELHCDWPTELALNLNDSGGTFTQTWHINHEKWVQLPGNNDNWPQNVMVNAETALVVSRHGIPQVRLNAGTYTLTGIFQWKSLPEYLQIPHQTALISVDLNDKTIAFPNVDPQGRFWLQSTKAQETKIENRLTIQAYRFIDDRIPLKVDINLQLDVSGMPREVLLGPLYSMDQMIPVELKSTLPARLEQNGKLRIQVKPGQWNLTLTVRQIGVVSSLQFTQPGDGFWPGEEIWIFNPNPDLRVVEIKGVPPIDPLQTSLPQHLHKYPLYRLLAGDTMQFKEIKRGDPLPAPDQLILKRNLWLRFDGSGYTIQDIITGAKKTNWRFEMNPPLQLGRVTVDGQEQFITTREGSDKPGIELRKGILNLQADSELYGNISQLPATGWDHDFQQVNANLFLPPGWKLVNARGMDNVQGTWVKRWTLLDFFVVLILTIAIARLFSMPMATLAFVSLVLIYHEPNAPRWIWLAILICVALLRYLPDGKFKKSIKVLQIINVIILIVIAIPFSIDQLRIGIFPQLEKPWQTMTTLPAAPPQKQAHELQYEEAPAKTDIPVEADSIGRVTGALEERKKVFRSQKGIASSQYDYSSPRKQVAQYDPTMVNQTGPGLPNWKWNTVPFNWSGPVQKEQNISLILLGPKINLVLSFIRVFLLILLTMGILDIRFRHDKENRHNGLKALFLAPLILLLFSFPSPSQANQIPSPELFEELRTRLLEKDDCFPDCADISQMDIKITPDSLTLQFSLTVQTDVAIPLPGDARHWLPQRVLVNGEKAQALFRTNNQLWLLAHSGIHDVEITGKIPMQNNLQLPFPLKPHKVQTTAEGWTIEGVNENGIPDNQIQFQRIVPEQSITNQILETGILPPFLLIERTLRIGLTWKIETQIKRISPAGSAVVFDYPLLANESVVTEGVEVKDNQANITLDPQQSYLQWESVLEKDSEISLNHAQTDLWTEIWRVDVSPIFHMETSGIPVIHHQQGKRWYPTWHPWPGEKVTLNITRPHGVEGQTITIDKVHINNKPGRRSTNTEMTLSVRSSQGGQHSISLPQESQLMEVKINDRVLPIRQKENTLTLPITPGKQEVKINWSEANGISTYYRTPKVDLGLNSVNSSIDLKLPPNRWPLFVGGPLMGPAILFWSVVLIILLVAFGLGKTGMTPLKFHQWFLLGIGMSQSNIAASVLVVGWLIILELRHKAKPDMDKTTFNMMQIGIAALTIFAISSLIMAIIQGLLGHPDMNIIGNQSNSRLLKWYQDHSSNVIPQAWIISIPMLYYRLAMLTWAMWISFSLINLLKWGWKNYTEPVIWHKIPRKAKRRTKTKKKKDEQIPEGEK